MVGYLMNILRLSSIDIYCIKNTYNCMGKIKLNWKIFFFFYIHVNSLYTLQYTTHNIISIIWNVFDNKAFCCATKDNFLLLIFIYLFFLLQICNVKPREWNFKFVLLFLFWLFSRRNTDTLPYHIITWQCSENVSQN